MEQDHVGWTALECESFQEFDPTTNGLVFGIQGALHLSIRDISVASRSRTDRAIDVLLRSGCRHAVVVAHLKVEK